MVPSEAIKPISYLKAHASEIIRDVSNNQKTMIITQNGEAKVILQDVKLYEQIQQSLAMLKILALSNKSLKDGITLEVTQNYLNLLKAKERVLASNQSVHQAEENYRVTNETFKNGLALNSDLHVSFVTR